MKLTTFSVARTKHNSARLITDSESTIKINVTSGWSLFLILLTSTVIYKDFWIETSCAISLKLQGLSS